MNTRRTWSAYNVMAIVILVAVMTLAPAGGAAGHSLLNGQTGICVTGQVIDKAHNGLAGLTVTATTGNTPLSAVSDANGRFTFNIPAPGKVTLKLAVPDAWKVTDTEISFDVAYGHGTCYDVRFKVQPYGCIIARKVDEQNNPLKDWKIKAVGVIDPEKLTDANGVARFDAADGIVPGLYVVSEDLKYPYQAKSPTSQTVTVPRALSDKDCVIVTFQNQRQPTSCISGTKVNDNHEPLKGWTIYAKPVSAAGPIFTTTTDANGRFTFPDLTLGAWTLWEDVKQWWTPVTPGRFDVTLTTPIKPDDQKDPNNCVQVRFKNRPPDLCAVGYKVDENGVGLAGWTIIASYPVITPTMFLTTTTDALGYFRFVDLGAQGDWKFTEQLKTGWTTITPQSAVVGVWGGACARVPTFRNQSPRGCVEGWKRDDLGVGLPGWNISLQRPGGGGYQHRDTDGTGYFRFDGLPMGEYEVFEEPQIGWSPTSPTKVVVKLTPNDTGACAPVELINEQVERDICIDGYKLDYWGGVGLPGFAVTARNLISGAVITQTTNGLGYFRFSNLAPGSYEVAVKEKDGWAAWGASTTTVKVDWPPKLQCTPLKFYNVQKGAPPKPSTCRWYHTVQPGQTLSGLAAWYGVSVNALMAANGIANPNTVYAGRKLCIP